MSQINPHNAVIKRDLVPAPVAPSEAVAEAPEMAPSATPVVPPKKPKYVKPPIVEPHVLKIKGKCIKDEKPKKSSGKASESSKKSPKENENKFIDVKQKGHESPNSSIKSEKKLTKRKKSLDEENITKKIKTADPVASSSGSTNPNPINNRSYKTDPRSANKSSRKPVEMRSLIKPETKPVESNEKSNKKPTKAPHNEEDRKRKLKEWVKADAIKKTLKIPLNRNLIEAEQKKKRDNKNRDKNHVITTKDIVERIKSKNGVVAAPGSSKTINKPKENHNNNPPVLLSSSPTYKTSKSPLVDYLTIELGDVFTKITNWKATWFEEQKICHHSPPIHGNSEIKVMGKHFESYDDYNKTISKLIYFELWSNLYDSLFKNSNSRYLRTRSFMNW